MQPDRLERVEREILHHPDPVVTAPELADRLEDVTRRDVLDDLRLLERAGAVDSKPTGANAVAWWHTERVTRAPPRSPADDPAQVGFADAVELADDEENRGPASISSPCNGAESDADRDDQDAQRVLDTLDPELEDALEPWRPGRDARERRERRAAGVEVLEWARDRPGVELRRRDVVEALYPAAAVEGQSDDTFWRNVARPALQHAADAGLVDDSGRTYEWLPE